MKKYNYFYKITNNINGDFYYGFHTTNNLNDGYMGSGVALHEAYSKFGIENFTKEIIKYFNTRKEAYEYEAKMLTKEVVNNPHCLNLKTGGLNDFIYCEETIEKNRFISTGVNLLKGIVFNSGSYLTNSLLIK